MKSLLAIIFLACLIMPCTAMNDKQDAYFQGLEDGWHLAMLRMTNSTEYNEEAQKYNVELYENLNATEAQAKVIGQVVASGYELPEIFREG